MSEPIAIAIVGVGAILPDAPDAQTFWKNIQAGRYSISDVPAERWRAELFYDPDPAAPDKTYSKIGGWVSGFKLDAKRMGIAIPPRVLAQVDEVQQWALAASFEALQDYGWPERRLDSDRMAVILGSALGGEHHYRTTIRIHLPEYLDILSSLPAFQNLTGEAQSALLEGLTAGLRSQTPIVTEDTMPGELSNVIAGRVANVFNFSGPNFVTDAACASSLAALQSAVEGLLSNRFDAVLTGGLDRNMGPEAFVKFSKIGALSPDGSRPYAEGANGFVMGEGAAIFLLKRLADAERDGDKIYAVVRGIGASSDGKGKGITAPNPLGQQRAIERAWKNADVSPASVGLIEGHGTSTRVGDLAEVSSLDGVFGQLGLKPGSVALGSVKSNFGHLKGAAGAAGLLKAILALNDHLLPPSVNFHRPNPQIDFSRLPFYVPTGTRPWEVRPGEVRRAGVSAFGFGGTNFHVVLEEYLPGVLTKERAVHPGVDMKSAQAVPAQPVETVPASIAKPYRGLFFVSADSAAGLRQALSEKLEQAKQGSLPPTACPTSIQLGKAERLVIDYEDQKDLLARADKALKALETNAAEAWQALSVQGIYRGSGKPGKTAFLFPGQGSQYVNMLRDLREAEPIVAETFREADAVMTPILGKPLTDYIFVSGDDETLAQAEAKLRHTDITQPAILAVNVALMRVLAKFGFKPDLVIGHSLGEYAALVAAGVLSLSDALQVVSARGQEMNKVASDDNGCMAAVSAPLAEVERILGTIEGYVVIANMNSPVQCVIGGRTSAVEAAIAAFLAAGFQATRIPVSHAFHTSIVAPASQPLRQVIARMNVQSPTMPIVANVTGGLYPTSREEILDILAAQVASPVRFVQGINTLYEEGARIFVEVGPKRVLSGLASDILKDKEKKDIAVLATNHPRKGDLASINEALCRLYAAGVTGTPDATPAARPDPLSVSRPAPVEIVPSRAAVSDGRLPLTGSVVISGAGLGLPGRGRHVFDDNNILSLLNGEMRIEPLPAETRRSMLEKRPVRLVKSETGAVMQPIDDMELTIKLAGQRGDFDPVNEFGFSPERLEAIDISTQLAIAAGIEALRDAGIPLVMTYKPTSTGGTLPDGWKLPEALADETGIIFGSAFPGHERMADEAERFYQSQAVLKQLEELHRMAALVPARQTDLKSAFAKRIAELEAESSRLDYHFNRRYLFRVLAMGHSQFAECIGARGPNTYVNAACATTTHAIAIAEDWIRAGRARRVLVIAGDDVTSGSLPQWIGTSLLASGVATTEGDLRLASLPFDRRRNGMIMGMAAAALVVESEDAVRERGMRAICEILASHIANSAFHGTRLNINHISRIMETLLVTAERRFGISRSRIAAETMFVSHETYTPARGGSASAEIHALRQAFGEKANQVVITNTKGFTGHTMGVGVEDIVAVKALEYGIVPPIAHIEDGFEPDPELGDLNLSHGGKHPVQFALRLGAGFGSQIAMTLLRKIPGQGERVDKTAYGRWLSDISGYPETELEITQRTLRVKDQGAPTRTPSRSRWEYGQGPTLWAASPQPEAAAPASVPQTLPAQSAANLDEIKAYLLAAVSEKTGYPIEILDLDLDLEADLGIDTVKQAELFAAMREHYNIPRREDLRLADYNTLAKVIGFVSESLGAAAAPAAAPQPAVQADAASDQPVTPGRAASAGTEEIKAYLLAAVSEKTGYPVEMLELDLDLEADLGIDTVKQAELFAAVREQYSIPRREDLRLADYNTLAKVIGFVEESLNAVLAPATESSPAVQPAAAEEPATPSAVSTVSAEEIKAYLLSAVSEKTGYPIEVLELDLDLEADLGIDTVKQAELFAALREQYHIPRREDLRLADYNTLAKVIGFVEEALRSRSEAPSPAGQPAAPAALPVSAEGETQPGIVRRVPVPALRPRLDLCSPTGVDLNAETRVLVVEGKAKTGEPLVRKLRSRQVEVLRLSAGTGSEEITKKVDAWLAEGSIRGVYFLPGLEVESKLAEMTAEDWQSGLDQRLYSLYAIMRALPEETFLVCATRLGGLHGYSAEGATSPMGGAVSGFAKAVARERLKAFVKVVDFESGATAASIGSRLIEETLRDPGAVEIGWENDLRYGIAAVEEPLPAESNFTLETGSIFLVSGGSGGIIRPIVEDLVRATRGTFYLLDRAPLPAPDDPDILRLAADREGLKNDLITRLASGGKKATPVQVEQALLASERSAATLQTLKVIEQLGGRAHYLACDVTNPAAVADAIQKVKDAEGRVDVFLHAAGIERSRKLESKPLDEFRLVVSVKADGFFNIFKAMESKSLLPRAMVFFSSVAGRFGNSGQTDYSAANDLLCKIASSMRSQHPEIKAVAIDWSAWGGVGMATRGNIPALMKMAGIDMLPPEQAAPMVRAELLAGSGEAILAGSLGLLLEPSCPHGGMDLERADRALRAGKPVHTMLSHVTDFDLQRGLVLEAELDPQEQPFLRDHALNGTPVLPGVMGIEGFSAAARHIGAVLASDRKGLEVSKLEDIRFLAAFKFYRNEPRRVTWIARSVRERAGLVVYVTLESTRLLKTGSVEHIQHFSGKVYLEPQGAARAGVNARAPKWNGRHTVKAEDIYRLYFHGPAFQVLEGVQRSGGALLGKLNQNLPAITSEEHTLVSAPTLVELCFQTAGIWEIGTTGTLALPRSIESLTLYRQSANGAAIYAEVKPIQSADGSLHFDARVVDAQGRLYLELKKYRTTPLPDAVEKALLAPLEALVRDA
ncbi:MAG: beta-ketoacyl synthase [Anaerolineaceae bacterium]|nr:MAG: beta-ketoacyl synthase [Anaerolineaceae bacterium]